MLELELITESLRKAIGDGHMEYEGFARDVQRLIVLAEQMEQELRHIRETHSHRRVVEL
jgi:hypothetical protein